MIRKTARSRNSHAEDLAASGALTPDGAPAVAPATLFVAHAHSCSFVNLLDALEAYLAQHELEPAATFLWIDVVCIRHHRIPEEIAQVALIQRAAGAVVVVLDPPSAPVCLERAWVLFEVAHAVLSRAVSLQPVSLGLAFAGSAAGSEAELAPPKSAFIVNAREAQAAVQKERDAILARIERAFGADGNADALERYAELVQSAIDGCISASPARSSYAPARVSTASSAVISVEPTERGTGSVRISSDLLSPPGASRSKQHR